MSLSAWYRPGPGIVGLDAAMCGALINSQVEAMYFDTQVGMRSTYWSSTGGPSAPTERLSREVVRLLQRDPATWSRSA